MEARQGEELVKEPVTPSMPTPGDSEGKVHLVEIESKRMLGVLMQAFGSRKMPEFTEKDCGEQGVRVTVTIDVSCAMYYFGENTKSAVIEGEPEKSKVLACRSAVLKAVKYLNDNHSVKFVDFSTKVIHVIEGGSALDHINAALYSLDEVIQQWEITLRECKELSVKLSTNDGDSDGVEDENEKCTLYRPLNNCIGGVIKVYDQKVSEARTKAKALQFLRKKYHEESTRRSMEELKKGCMHTVYASQKMILDCVLECLGSDKAKYTNSPTTYGLMKGVANFYLKPVKRSGCSGHIQVKGKGRDSQSAEEDAAYQALLFIEDGYKVRIHDIYHDERLCAEKHQKHLVGLLEQILNQFPNIKRNWGAMVRLICKGRKNYMNDTKSINSSESGQQAHEARLFCAEQMDKLEKDSAERFQDCAEIFEQMTNLGGNVQLEATMAIN